MKITAVLPGFPPFADAPDVEAAMLAYFEGSAQPLRVAECRQGAWTCSADPNLLAEALVFVQTAFTRKAFEPTRTRTLGYVLAAPSNLAERITEYEAELKQLRKDRAATTIVWVVRNGQDYYGGLGMGVSDPERAKHYATERAALADSGWQGAGSHVDTAVVRVRPNWTCCAACSGSGIAPKGPGSMAAGGGPDFLCGVCRGAGRRPPHIAGVLLLPTVETREALLAPGAPLAARLGDSVWISGKFDPAVVGDTAPLALVLAWAGVEHDKGCQRAFEVACPGGMEKTIGLVAGRPPLRNALHRALYAQRFGFGEIVYVDKDGNEVPG